MTDYTLQLKAIIAELFMCDKSTLNDDTGPGDIQGWDSLGHVMLLEQIQANFDTQIPIELAINARSISDLAALLKSSPPA